MRHPNYYKQILHALDRLYKAHPKYNMGKHISTALDGSDIWSISDKEFLFAIQKYEIELNMDVEHEDEIEKIIKDGMNLERMFLDEEED